jgi:hypothetical protein
MDSIFNSHRPPPGWLVFNGVLTADASVAGYLARGREVRGQCYDRACRRWCVVELEKLAGLHVSRLRISDLKPLLRCNRLGGCAIDFHESGGTEIALSMLTNRPYVGVRIECQLCRRASVALAEAVIGKLKAAGTGDGATLVSKLSELIGGPCGKCQKKRWSVDVLWGDPNGKPHWQMASINSAPR